MGRKYRAPIILSKHAIERWHERVGDDKPIRIRGIVKNAIRNAVKSGMKVRNGAAVIKVTPEIQAVVAPSLQGGWEVLTFYRDPHLSSENPTARERGIST